MNYSSPTPLLTTRSFLHYFVNYFFDISSEFGPKRRGRGGQISKGPSQISYLPQGESSEFLRPTEAYDLSGRLTPRYASFEEGVLAISTLNTGVELGTFLSLTEVYDWREFPTEAYD